jgi:hypothetical protein
VTPFAKLCTECIDPRDINDAGNEIHFFVSNEEFDIDISEALKADRHLSRKLLEEYMQIGRVVCVVTENDSTIADRKKASLK